jgi:hypothetical protein
MFSYPKKAVQACKSDNTPFHIYTDNYTWALSIFDTSSTPRLLISPFHPVIDAPGQPSSPSLFRILVSFYFRGAGEDDWIRSLPSWQSTEATEATEATTDEADAGEGQATPALELPEIQNEDSNATGGAELSDEQVVRIVLSLFFGQYQTARLCR